MTDLTDLAARVMALTGPDREIDEEIAVAISSDPTSRVIYGKDLRFFKARGDGRIPFHVGGGGGVRFGIAYQHTNYTASVDAALTLPRSDAEARKIVRYALIAMEGRNVQDFRAALARYITSAALMERSET